MILPSAGLGEEEEWYSDANGNTNRSELDPFVTDELK